MYVQYLKWVILPSLQLCKASLLSRGHPSREMLKSLTHVNCWLTVLKNKFSNLVRQIKNEKRMQSIHKRVGSSTIFIPVLLCISTLFQNFALYCSKLPILQRLNSDMKCCISGEFSFSVLLLAHLPVVLQTVLCTCVLSGIFSFLFMKPKISKVYHNMTSDYLTAYFWRSLERVCSGACRRYSEIAKIVKSQCKYVQVWTWNGEHVHASFIPLFCQSDYHLYCNINLTFDRFYYIWHSAFCDIHINIGKLTFIWNISNKILVSLVGCWVRFRFIWWRPEMRFSD